MDNNLGATTPYRMLAWAGRMGRAALLLLASRPRVVYPSIRAATKERD